MLMVVLSSSSKLPSAPPPFEQAAWKISYHTKLENHLRSMDKRNRAPPRAVIAGHSFPMGKRLEEERT
eukprot:6747403-Pyramimonas_sp.AAC.2